MNQRPGQVAGFGGRDAFLGKPGLKRQLAPNPLAALDLRCSLPSMMVMGDALPSLCPTPSPTAQADVPVSLPWLFEYVHHALHFKYFHYDL